MSIFKDIYHLNIFAHNIRVLIFASTAPSLPRPAAEFFLYCSLFFSRAAEPVRRPASLFIRQSFHPSVRPSVHISVRPSDGLSVSQFFRPSVCLSVRPSVRPFVRPFIHPSVRPSIRPSVRPPSVRPFVRPVRSSVRPTRPSVRPCILSSAHPSDRPSNPSVRPTSTRLSVCLSSTNRFPVVSPLCRARTFSRYFSPSIITKHRFTPPASLLGKNGIEIAERCGILSTKTAFQQGSGYTSAYNASNERRYFPRGHAHR